MKTVRVRLLSLALALAMMVGLLPAIGMNALADGGYTGSGTKNDPYVALTYDGLRSLLGMTKGALTVYIKLGADIASDDTKDGYNLEVHGIVELDLAGHTVSRRASTFDSSFFYIPNDEYGTNSLSVYGNGGKVYANYYGVDRYVSLFKAEEGLKIYDGTYEMVNGYASEKTYCVAAFEGSAVHVYGGTFSAVGTVAMTTTGGYMCLHDGKFSSEDKEQPCLQCSAGTMVIDGGTFTTEGRYALNADDGTLLISGGDFISNIQVQSSGGSVGYVTSGIVTISKDVDDCLISECTITTNTNAKSQTLINAGSVKLNEYIAADAVTLSNGVRNDTVRNYASWTAKTLVVTMPLVVTNTMSSLTTRTGTSCEAIFKVYDNNKVGKYTWYIATEDGSLKFTSGFIRLLAHARVTESKGTDYYKLTIKPTDTWLDGKYVYCIFEDKYGLETVSQRIKLEVTTGGIALTQFKATVGGFEPLGDTADISAESEDVKKYTIAEGSVSATYIPDAYTQDNHIDGVFSPYEKYQVSVGFIPTEGYVVADSVPVTVTIGGAEATFSGLSNGVYTYTATLKIGIYKHTGISFTYAEPAAGAHPFSTVAIQNASALPNSNYKVDDVYWADNGVTGGTYEWTELTSADTFRTGHTYYCQITISLKNHDDYMLVPASSFKMLVNGKTVSGTASASADKSFTCVNGEKLSITLMFDVVGGGFTDVANGAYYSDAVKWAVENNVTQGTGGTTFSPNASCTRAQAVTFLWRAYGMPEPTLKTCKFTDVSSGAFYYKAMLWAIEKGITNGTGGTTFSPNMNCDRGQIVTFQYRAAGSPSVGSTNPFKDVANNAFYSRAVLWAVANKITNGTGDGTTFSPNEVCTRGQIVTFLYRQLGK